MKTRTDRILLAVFALSLAFYAADIVFGKGYYPWEIRLAFSFHAIPAFCLQLLLCRNIRRKWVAALPAVLLIGWCLLCLIQIFINTGWYALGWAIFLALSAAPAIGCALAWAVYGFHRLYKRGDIRG